MRIVALLLLLLAQAGAYAAPAPDPLAARACAALQALPAQRKQACCGTGGGDLSAICTAELAAAVARGAVKLDRARVDACAAASATALDGCGWVGPLLPKPPVECATLVEGALAAGKQCRSSLECSDGLYCRGVTPGGTGTCAAPAEPGGRCENPADNLVSFTRAKDDPRHPVCRGACLKGQCLALIDEGGACPSSAACANGLHCKDGHCTRDALPKLGEACSASAECGDGSICAEGRCATPKDGGATCKLPFECRSLECSNGTCADVCAVPRISGGI